MFESFKLANFPGKHPDAGADQGFLERGFICIKEVGFTSYILNILWKWNNLVSLRPNYFIFIEYLIAENPLNPLFPNNFAHLNDFSIRSFDCMVLRLFHTSSRYDFRSNVIRPLDTCTTCRWRQNWEKLYEHDSFSKYHTELARICMPHMRMYMLFHNCNTRILHIICTLSQDIRTTILKRSPILHLSLHVYVFFIMILLGTISYFTILSLSD